MRTKGGGNGRGVGCRDGARCLEHPIQLDARACKHVGAAQVGARLQDPKVAEAAPLHEGGLEVIRGHQRSSEVIRGHQRSSEVIRGHQRSSEVISGHHLHEGGLELPARLRECRRRIAGRRWVGRHGERAEPAGALPLLVRVTAQYHPRHAVA